MVERRREAPAAFHARELPDPLTRAVWVCEATEPALVLGSSQPLESVDQAACAAAGVEVVRRRSGGGAVLVVPGDLLWLDVLLPAGDPLWSTDVGRAFVWLGEAWVGALGDLGVEAQVNDGGMCTTRWSRLVCFAGLGTGEVATPSGVKLVGLSQRRTRLGARFQCAALGTWDPEAVVRLLALPPGEQAEAVEDLRPVAGPVGVDLEALLDALLTRLP